jgi:hypothetical protein
MAAVSRRQGEGFTQCRSRSASTSPIYQFCPPGVCDHDGKHCSYQGDSRFMRVPAQLPCAQKGDLGAVVA